MNKEEAKKELIKLMGDEFINNHYTEEAFNAMAFGFSAGFSCGELHRLKQFSNGTILSYEKHNKA